MNTHDVLVKVRDAVEAADGVEYTSMNLFYQDRFSMQVDGDLYEVEVRFVQSVWQS